MYEAILKTAVEDPEFEFKVRTTPYPLTTKQKKVFHRADAYFETCTYVTVREYVMCWAKLAEGPIFAISVCFAVLATFVLHHITVERTSKLKLLQMVSGLQLGSYWFGNWLFDTCSMQLLVAATIALFVVFDPTWRVSIAVVFLYPIATVPVIYLGSFFVVNGGSSIMLIQAMLLVMITMSQTIFTMRLQSLSEYIGDCMMWFFRMFPGFPLVNSLYVEATA